jgi:hypothetical protein
MITNKSLIDLFEKNDEEHIEEFLIIFDRAKSEDIALRNAVDYYDYLRDEGISVEVEKIVEAAEDFGYDFSNFDNLIS